MTDTETRGDQPSDAAQRRTKGGFGSGAVLASAVVAAAFAALLVSGGIGVANAVSEPVTVSAKSSQTPSTPGTGAKTPVADPSTPPDRDSDQPEASEPKDTVYYIQPGDTLTSISAKLQVSVDAIADYNAVRDVNVISSGAALRVPFIYVPPTAAANG